MSQGKEKGGRADQNATTHITGLEGTDAEINVSSSNPRQPAIIELQAYEASNAELIRLNGKVPGKGWRDKAAMAVSEAMDRLKAGNNIGVRLRQTDLVIDVDPRNFEDGKNPLARLFDKLGEDYTAFPIVKTGSGGLHIYMTLPEPVQVLNELPDFKGVEFKSFGRQVVAAGSIHPETGKPYLWDDDPLAMPLGDCAPQAPSALIELIRRPVSAQLQAEAGDIEPEQLAEMLEALCVEDYRGEHGDWLDLMMACHHATSGSGREEFIEWSTSDPEYAEHGEVIRNRWDSLRCDAPGRSVTKATLFKALSEAGRFDLIPRTSAEEDFADIDCDDDDNDASRFEMPEKQLSQVESLNQGHFTVVFGQKFMVGRESYDRFLDRHRVEWIPDDAMRKHMNIRSIETEQGKAVGVGDWWLKHPQRRQYDRVIFDPSVSAAESSDEYNLWRGWSVQPVAGDWSHMQRVIRDVLCSGNEAYYQYVLKWAAYMVQHPERQAEVALVFRGEKGTGKGTFGRAMCQLAGQHGQHVTQQEHFTGRFNEHLNETVCLFVDEVQWKNDKQAEGALKGLITEPTLVFEGKFRPIYQGRNMLHVIIASNEDWVVPATADERRFAVFETDAHANRDLPDGFYEMLHAQMKSGGKEAMLYDLLNMELNDWHPRADIPQTDALTAQKVQGFNQDPQLFWWHKSLDEGQVYNATPELLSGDEWPDAFQVAAGKPKDELVDAVNLTAKELGSRRTYTKAAVAKFIFNMGATEGRVGTQRSWDFPPLEEARAAFEEHLGGKLDWDD